MNKKEKPKDKPNTNKPNRIKDELSAPRLSRTPGQLVSALLRVSCSQAIVTLGLAVIYLADLGVAPWDMFALGIANHTPLQYGGAMNAVGAAVILTNILMREKIGLTTIMDVLISGLTLNMWIALLKITGGDNLILYGSLGAQPAAASGGMFLVPRIVAFIVGVLVSCFGQYLVQKQAMGAGPRDTLVLALGRKLSGLPIGAVTWGVLAIVFLLGLVLGGPVGIGTVGAVFGMSLGQQLMCRFFHFEPRAVAHENIIETVRSLQ